MQRLSGEKPVKIQNIVAIGEKGEYKSTSTKDSHPIPRIIEHLRSLFDYARKTHEDALPQAEAQPYELVTRLTLNEFSLYTKDKPLTIDQYKELIAAIAHFAKQLPPNIHLVIATLPILWPDDAIHNTGIHVQSPRKNGGKPILHHFDKKMPAAKDPTYAKEGAANYRLYKEHPYVEADYYNSTMSPDKLLSDTAIKVNDPNQYRGAIRVKTQAGAIILVPIEICVEHLDKLGISDAKSLMEQLNKANKLAPEQASHILTSNSIDLHPKNLVSPSFIHADPIESIAVTYKPKRERIAKPAFGESLTLTSYKPKKVKAINTENMNRVEVDNYQGITSTMDFLSLLFNKKPVDLKADHDKAALIKLLYENEDNVNHDKGPSKNL